MLAGKRILITRTRNQASELAAKLEALGAIAVTIPTIKIAPPTSFAALDAALAAIRSYDWLIFTSANAVEAFHRRAQFHHLPAVPKKVAAIGPATTRAVEAIGLQVDLIPARYTAESLAEALLNHATTAEGVTTTMLLVRAEQARDVLPDTLRAAGVRLTIADAYRNQTPHESLPALRELLSDSAKYPDAITFTSSSTATNLFHCLEAADLVLPSGIVLASIGPITSQTLRDLGYPPTVEAGQPSVPALVESLQDYFAEG
jgi:uroporphyrinogen-III synthase